MRRGRLVGLPDILVEVEGVVILVQGWRAEIDQFGRLLTEAPLSRHPITGPSSPCIALRAVVVQAVADLVERASLARAVVKGRVNARSVSFTCLRHMLKKSHYFNICGATC